MWKRTGNGRCARLAMIFTSLLMASLVKGVPRSVVRHSRYRDIPYGGR
jgi:hypothetical protein